MIRRVGKRVYHISAGGFILDQNKILLVKNFYHGGIIPPHGHQEKGETLLETAMREICEETGYCYLQPIKRLSPVQYTYRAEGLTHTKTEHRWVFTLRKKIKRKKLNNNESKGLENRWYTIDQALQFATFENTKKHLRVIKQMMHHQVFDPKSRRKAKPQ